MKHYDLKGAYLESKKAVIGVLLPEPARNNKYGIYDIYNISDQEGNKIVVHFKDFIGSPLEGVNNFESFVIDLSDPKFRSIDFTKCIYVAFHHENDILKNTPEKIFEEVYNPIVTPDKTGKGTIRDIV
ncbi:hypothetical protein [Flavobacterium sp. T12S277]|uniref:hypothetical protein n=1 Tax=Flavobacterium sp. T12S277 TaxID=3402752 RepID=UPI003AD9844E